VDNFGWAVSRRLGAQSKTRFAQTVDCFFQGDKPLVSPKVALVPKFSNAKGLAAIRVWLFSGANVVRSINKQKGRLGRPFCLLVLLWALVFARPLEVQAW